MITSHLIGRKGRFGNQMFQYAALASVAKTKNFKYGIRYSNQSKDPHKHLVLFEAFKNLKAEDCTDHVYKQRFIEPTFHFNEALFYIPDETDIVGHFQSEMYFKHLRQDILNEFTFRDEIVDVAMKTRKQVNSPVISLHIRLGDYKETQDSHPICSIEYYKKALQLLPKDLPIFIFSDEPKTALEIFSQLNRDIKIIVGSQYVDMCLMTMCDYHIIANSTFSWWGAWMSNSSRVIAPKKWFGNTPTAPKYWDTIYCGGWVVVE